MDRADLFGGSSVVYVLDRGTGLIYSTELSGACTFDRELQLIYLTAAQWCMRELIYLASSQWCVTAYIEQVQRRQG